MNDTPDIYHAIAHSLAATVGFKCRKRDRSHPAPSNYVWYCWYIGRDEYSEDRWRQPPPEIPSGVVTNPCGEIPLDYELYVAFTGDTFHINTPALEYCLNDPNLITTLINDFSDLDTLSRRIRNAHVALIKFGKFGKKIKA
jgi:hypothetical protein